MSKYKTIELRDNEDITRWFDLQAYKALAKELDMKIFAVNDELQFYKRRVEELENKLKELK